MALLLKVSNLHLKKEKTILKDVSFELERGEILTVLGPSGSGKSSLLRCLNRLETLEGGEILLEGRDGRVLDPIELRRRIGMVFQVPALLPATVRENIRMGPTLHKQEMDDAACESLVQKVGLDPAFLDRSVERLSLGEQQRVALAQVLANRPDILLLDEPTSALDPTAVLTIENLIKTIHREFHTAILLVTHDVPQALRFNTKTLVLVDGKILAGGNIQDLMNSPQNETLARFFEGRLNEKTPRTQQEGGSDGN